MDKDELCWCGSGKKHESCHLGREAQSPVAPHEAYRRLRRGFSTGMCLHPQASQETCRGRAIRAHTVQRSGGLQFIARNGHVYWFDPYQLNRRHDGSLQASLIGVREASTFPGFCSYHDCETFSPLEAQRLSFTPEQCFLLGYRALCRELHCKRRALAFITMLRQTDRGKPAEAQVQIQGLANKMEKGTRIGLNNLEATKQIWDRTLLSRDFSEVGYYVLVFDRCPDTMCSGAEFPDQDFNDRPLLNVLDQLTEIIAFNLIGTKSSGAYVFSWLRPAPHAEALARSLDALQDQDKAHAVLRYVFSGCENTFISPQWWDALPEGHRIRLTQRMNMAGSPFDGWPSLKDDGTRAVDWQVVDRHSALN